METSRVLVARKIQFFIKKLFCYGWHKRMLNPKNYSKYEYPSETVRLREKLK
jgi:hypothetical protein